MLIVIVIRYSIFVRITRREIIEELKMALGLCWSCASRSSLWSVLLDGERCREQNYVVVSGIRETESIISWNVVIATYVRMGDDRGRSWKLHVFLQPVEDVMKGLQELDEAIDDGMDAYHFKA